MAIWSCSLPTMASSFPFKVCANSVAFHHLCLSSLRHRELLGPWHATHQLWKSRVLPPTLQLFVPLPPSIALATGWKWQTVLEDPQKHAAQPDVFGLPIPNLMHVKSHPLWEMWPLGVCKPYPLAPNFCLSFIFLLLFKKHWTCPPWGMTPPSGETLGTGLKC